MFLEIMQTIQGKWVRQFGRIYRNWLGFRPFVQISSPIFMEVNYHDIGLLQVNQIICMYLDRKFWRVRPSSKKVRLTTSSDRGSVEGSCWLPVLYVNIITPQ